MARTKQTAKKTPSSQEARLRLATKRGPRSFKDLPMTSIKIGKRHKKKGFLIFVWLNIFSGALALQEIKKYQRSQCLLIPRAPFFRLVRTIAQEFMPDVRFAAEGVLALQVILKIIYNCKIQMFLGK